MSETTDKIVKDILESYREDQLTTQIDKSSQPNRAVVVDVLESIRKLVFPGFFEVKNLRSEYIEYYVGELVEDIKYHLSKQMMKAYLCCEPSSCGFAEAIELEVGSKCDEFLMTAIPPLTAWKRLFTPIRESTPSPFTGLPMNCLPWVFL